MKNSTSHMKTSTAHTESAKTHIGVATDHIEDAICNAEALEETMVHIEDAQHAQRLQ